MGPKKEKKIGQGAKRGRKQKLQMENQDLSKDLAFVPQQKKQQPGSKGGRKRKQQLENQGSNKELNLVQQKNKQKPIAKRGRKQKLQVENQDLSKELMSVQQQKKQQPGAKGGRKRKQQLENQDPNKKLKLVHQQKKQKPLVWKSPEIENEVLNREQSSNSNRFCPDFFNDQDNYEMMLLENIQQLKNELILKSDNYRNDKNWIKEVYNVCQKEIKKTKDTLSKIYELKNYYKLIWYKEDIRKNPNLTVIGQELNTFGFNVPLFIGSRNETGSPRCGSIPNQPLLKKVSKKSDVIIDLF